MMVWLSRRLWRAGLGGSLGTAIVCLVGAAAIGAIAGLVLSAPGGDTATVEILVPSIVMCLLVTTVVLWSVAGHSVVIRRSELELLEVAGATRGQLARLVIIDALVVGAGAGAVGGLASLALVFPLAGFLISHGYLVNSFGPSVYPQVVLWTVLTTGGLAAVGSLSAVLSVIRLPRRSAEATARPALARTRAVLGLLALVGSAIGLISVARDQTLVGLQNGLNYVVLLIIALCLLAPLILQAGSSLVAAASLRGSVVGTVAAADAQASRQRAPVIAPVIATVLVLYLIGIGATSETAGRTALTAGLAGASVVTDARALLSAQQVSSFEAGLPAGVSETMTVGRARALWLPDGDEPEEWPLGIVDPQQYRDVWQGSVVGNLADFASSGTAVVSRSDALSNMVGSTLRFKTVKGVLSLRVVATVAATGPWGVLVSPEDGRRFQAPSGYDVVTDSAPVAEAATAQGWRVDSATAWIAGMSVEQLTGGAGSGDVGVVTAIPVLLCAALATAGVAMARTRRVRQRQVMSLAGAGRGQIVVLDQLQALLPIVSGLCVAVAGAAFAVAASRANVSNRIGIDLPSQFSWPALTLIVVAFIVPPILVTAAQSVIAPHASQP